MIKILLLIIFGVSFGQEINPVQVTVISSQSAISIDQYQNQLYTFSTKSILQYDLNNGHLIQNRTFATEIITLYTSFAVSDRYLMFSYYDYDGAIVFGQKIAFIPLNNLLSDFILGTTIGGIFCVEIYNENQIFIGTSYGFELWDLLTLKRLESYSRKEVRQIQIFNDSLFLLDSYLIEERKIIDLNTVYDSYSIIGIYVFDWIKVNSKGIFIGLDSGLIQQINWYTKQIVYSFSIIQSQY